VDRGPGDGADLALAARVPFKVAQGGNRSGQPPGQGKRKTAFTPRQGQFLAFIHLYRELHRQGPAELDLVQYFLVTPPLAHGMVVKLEQLGLITREPGEARSIRVAVPEEQIPELEDVEGPPW
jgi:DNA-binding MarR family transcriptional regulator